MTDLNTPTPPAPTSTSSDALPFDPATLSSPSDAAPGHVVPLEQFDKQFGKLIELSSEALGAAIVDVSDEFFVTADHLLRVPPAVSMKGQFGPNGALFDGWESRRHNPRYDWVIIKLGALGSIVGCDIDTGHFAGNESPASGVWGANVPEGEKITEDSPLWSNLLPITPLGPASRHLFHHATPSPPVTHLKLTMHPDGGLGRFRAYGHVVPPPPPPSSSSSSASGEAVDLAYVLNGGTVTGESDQHFGRGGNLILPGRGKDMGDGWETRRSRGRLGKGKGDWVVVKLAEAGYLEWVDIDTLHFVGNFPESAELYGINSTSVLPDYNDAGWTRILSKTKLGPHRQHFYQLEHPEKAWTHVRLDIYPDGGVKRLRLFGRPASQYPSFSALASLPSPASATTSFASTASTSTSTTAQKSVPKLPLVPLTPSAFAPYGSVIQSYPDERSAPKEIKVKTVNFGTARKFNHLAPVTVLPSPAGSGAGKGEVNFCVFRCEQQEAQGVSEGGKRTWEVKVLERHEYSSQAFVPMGGEGSGEYLVLVALPSTDGSPDLSTLRAFRASSAQGISYNPNVWHHPLLPIGSPSSSEKMDFACVVNETGVPGVDCEIKWFEEGTVAVVVEV